MVTVMLALESTSNYEDSEFYEGIKAIMANISQGFNYSLH